MVTNCNHHYVLKLEKLPPTRACAPREHQRKYGTVCNLYVCDKCGVFISSDEETIEVMNTLSDDDLGLYYYD